MNISRQQVDKLIVGTNDVSYVAPDTSPTGTAVLTVDAAARMHRTRAFDQLNERDSEMEERERMFSHTRTPC